MYVARVYGSDIRQSTSIYPKFLQEQTAIPEDSRRCLHLRNSWESSGIARIVVYDFYLPYFRQHLSLIIVPEDS